MMQNTGLIKTFKIECDPITGSIEYKNEDNMTFSEVLGSIEYVKMMIMKEWLEETEND